MLILLIINCVVAITNTLLLIAIAGTTAKMLRYTMSEEKEDAGSPTPKGLVDLPVRRPLTYADIAINYDGVQSRLPNFDGMGEMVEES